MTDMPDDNSPRTMTLYLTLPFSPHQQSLKLPFINPQSVSCPGKMMLNLSIALELQGPVVLDIHVN